MADARIFFSYARSDSEFVLKVATALRAEGRAVWVDQLDIPKGARWDEEVEKALKASGCLLVVMSPASAQSQNVADEVSYALDEKRSVLPILLHPCSIPFRLKRLQYIDFTGSFDVAYRQLAAALDSQKAAAADASVAAPASPAGVDVRPAASPPAAAAPAPTARPVPPREPPQEPPSTRASLRAAPERPSFQQDPQPARVPTQESAAAKRLPTGLIAGAGAGALVLAGVGYVLFGTSPEPAPTAEPRAEAPPARPVREVTAPPAATPAGADALGDKAVKDFVVRFLAAQSAASAVGLLDFYADRVDYFDHKGVDKNFIVQDKQAYYRRWPQVGYVLTGDVRIDRGQDTATASYTIEYRVANPTRADSRSGTAFELLEIRLVDGQPKIAAQRQRVAAATN